MSLPYTPRYLRASTVIAAALLILSTLAPASLQAQEYTPESLEVKAMVESGVRYLESRINAVYSDGYECLVGYAIYTINSDAEHPCVKKGLEEAIRIAEAPEGSTLEKSDDYVYCIGVAMQLMVAVDPAKYSPHLQKMFNYLVGRQRADGGWGHKYEKAYSPYGDTSQTQYALLGLWSMDQADFKIPPEMIERAFAWLATTQYPEGCYAHRASKLEYSPNHHMTSCGMSGAMLAGDLLRALRPGGNSAMSALEGNMKMDVGVPGSMRRVLETETNSASKVTPQKVTDVVKKAFNWMETTPYNRVTGSTWHYYMLYSVERYRAFLEAMNGKREKSPKWYNDLVKELKEAQSANGTWGQFDPDAGSIESCTAFAVLVLSRATQKSIGELSEATQFGGMGLKADMSSVDFSSGKVEDKKEITEVDAALKLLEENNLGVDNSNDVAKRIRLDADPKKRNEQLERFARMIRSDSAVSRRVAAKILCRGDNFDMVPHLIYALSDPDGITNINAENSLRVLSRQINTYKIPKTLPEGKLDFPADIRIKAQEYWKKWYSGIRPDYQFLDDQ